MSVLTPFFFGSVAFFMVYACLQSFFMEKTIRRIYLYYSAYLLFILLYFFVRTNFSYVYVGQQLEAPLFSGAVICYLLFAKSLFRGRESYQYFSGIANVGIYTILLCLAVEKTMHLWDHPDVAGRIKMVEGILRAFTGALGIYAITYTYSKTPEDHYFSKYFLIGNYSVLAGGVLSIILTVFALIAPKGYPVIEEWGLFNRMFIIQVAILAEILCFSMAITRRQLHADTPALALAATSGSLLLAKNAPSSPVQLPKRIAFKTNKGFEIILKSDIVLIQGGGNSANFIKLFREGQSTPVVVLQTLSNTFNALSEGDPTFERPHRSYIVNTSKICALLKDEDGVMVAVMSNKMEVPVSAEKLNGLKDILELIQT